MSTAAPIMLRRSCRAIRVPSGENIVLEEGTEVLLVQQLGASCTVQHSRIGLARIALADADALGLENGLARDESGDDHPVSEVDEPEFSIERILDDLRQVYDPEIPINIVDLGLIYSCDDELAVDGRHRVRLKMAMTAPGCGMGDVLRREVGSRIEALPGVASVQIIMVFDPPWDLSRMSEAARLQLGL